MAWERSFEKRVMKVRERELKYQKLNYKIEVRDFPYRIIRLLMCPPFRSCSLLSGMLSCRFPLPYLTESLGKHLLSLSPWFLSGTSQSGVNRH